MPAGILEHLWIRYASDGTPPGGGSEWSLKFKIDNTEYESSTSSRIALAVLETALLGHYYDGVTSQVPVEVEISEEDKSISCVRLLDEREDVCKGVLEEQYSPFRAKPLAPTAFANESPVKWGFFFQIDSLCREYKGTSLDLYAVAESIWREGGYALTTLTDGLITHMERAE